MTGPNDQWEAHERRVAILIACCLVVGLLLFAGVFLSMQDDCTGRGGVVVDGVYTYRCVEPK